MSHENVFQHHKQLNNTIDERFKNFDALISQHYAEKKKSIYNGRIRFMSRPERDQAGKNWFKVQNIALQKTEGKHTKWKISSEVKKMG